MEQKEHKIDFENIKEITNRTVFDRSYIRGKLGDIISETGEIDNEYKIIFNDNFPIECVRCEREPVVNIKDGTVNVVSMQLDNVLSILTKK